MRAQPSYIMEILTCFLVFSWQGVGQNNKIGSITCLRPHGANCCNHLQQRGHKRQLATPMAVGVPPKRCCLMLINFVICACNLGQELTGEGMRIWLQSSSRRISVDPQPFSTGQSNIKTLVLYETESNKLRNNNAAHLRFVIFSENVKTAGYKLNLHSAVHSGTGVE